MPLPLLRRVRALLGIARHELRHWRATHLPSRSQRVYDRWARQRSAARQQRYPREPEPGLLTILTAVWDGSPVEYLRELAASIARQNLSSGTEWVIVDNGCSAGPISNELERLRPFSWVRIIRLRHNAGIVGGLRAGLEAAQGRYTMAVDGDDLLYPDALQTVAHYIQEAGFPVLLYTDEDKTNGRLRMDPYLKPDWDPVLHLNSPYIAHLGIVDRKRALELGAYTDKATEGSADWDLFMRFAIAGETPVHVPEVVYSWRVHSESTARDVGNKSYIHSSQKRVLQRFVDSRIEPGRYAVTESPFFPGGAHFRIMKSSPGEHPILVFTLTDPAARASALLSIAQQASEEHAWILFQQAGLKVRYQDWLAESETLFELHPDAVMAGGLIVDPAGRVAEEAWYFGAEGACAGPYVGRRAESPGYFGELHKRRSASAVSMRCTVMRSGFLEETLRNIPGRATIGFFGAWAGAYAKRTGRRIIYSPFLGGVSTPNWSFKADAVEERLFCDLNRDVIPDTRYYSGQRSLQNPYAIA